MSLDLTSHTRVFAVLGDPVAHSLSPRIQNAALQAAGLDGVYVALQCDCDDLPGLVQGLARAGGGGNVTLPHKEEAARCMDRLTDAVRRTGACNTFWVDDDGQIVGDNTDVEGFRAAMAALLSEGPWGRRVLLLGAGGAARAAVTALLDDGVESLLLLNRTPERARALAARAGDPRVRVLTGPDELDGEGVDVVVNATRLGLAPEDPVPVDLEGVEGVEAVLDMVYRAQGTTPLVEAARGRGAAAADGREMLVQQGAAAFERWWGRAAPVEAMRQALAAVAGLPG